MDSLPEAVAAQIAACLQDEHHIAALRCTNRFWRGVFANPALWQALAACRFGAAAAQLPLAAAPPAVPPMVTAAATAATVGRVNSGGGQGAGRSAAADVSAAAPAPAAAQAGLGTGQAGLGTGPAPLAPPPPARVWPPEKAQVSAVERGGAQVSPPEQLFRQLASLRRPACRLDRVIWLDGRHLQEVTEPGSSSSRAIKVHNVSWLELAGRFPGVLPGRYRAAWRIRLQGSFHFQGGRLAARHLPASCAAAAAALASGAAGDPLLPILREDGVRGVLRHDANTEPTEARSTLTLITRAQLDQAFQQEGSGWFELKGGPFELTQLSVVYLKFHSLQGYKSGIIFDCARLERL